jgi:hypothetical protein
MDVPATLSAAARSAHDRRGPTTKERHNVIFAADYPFLNIFWTMLIFFAWVIWIWMVVSLLTDVFSRHDLSGWIKALWAMFVVVLPFLGVLIYLITNGTGMAERKAQQAQAARSQYEEHIRTVAGSGGAAAEIEQAKQLLDSGAVTQAEFDALKAKALA